MANLAIKMNKMSKYFFFGLLLIHLLLLITTRFTAWPEMMFWPYLLLKGWLPYRDISIAHNPLLLADLSVWYKVFGLSIYSLKAYTWIYILGSDLILYFIAKKLFNCKTALFSLIIYIPLQILYEGNGMWFDLMLTPIALCIYYFVSQRKYFFAGIFWALAFLTKQTAFWFLLPIVITFRGLSFKSVYKKLKLWLLGASLILLVFLTVIWILGVFNDYLFWAVKFGVGILPRAQGQVKLATLRQIGIASLPLIFLLPLYFKEKKAFLNIIPWIFAGMMGVFPRFEYFHLQPALPFIAIAGGLAFVSKKKAPRWVLSTFIAGLLVCSIIFVKFIARNINSEDRFLESGVLEVSEYIKSKTHEGDLVYIYNAWDNLYVLSSTLPATSPWVPFLPWYLEMNGVQEELVDSIVKNPPKLIVMGKTQENGLGAYIPKELKTYIDANYIFAERVGDYLIYYPNSFVKK